MILKFLPHILLQVLKMQDPMVRYTKKIEFFLLFIVEMAILRDEHSSCFLE